MDKRQFSFRSAVLLVAVSLCFFVLPAVFDYEAFIPVILGIGCLLGAVFFLLAGYSAE